MKLSRLLLAFALCMPSLIQAQLISIKCEKPGSLKSEIKKHPGITELKVSGVLNAKDMTEIYALSDLTALDLSGVSFDDLFGEIKIVDGKEKKKLLLYKDRFYLFHKHLKKLWLPSDCRYIDNILGPLRPYVLEDLYISYNCFKNMERYWEDVIAQNIHVANVQNNNGKSIISNGERASALKHLRFESITMVDTIFLDQMPSDFEMLKNVVPSIVKVGNSCTFLYDWRQQKQKVTKDDLNGIDFICSGAFTGHEEIKELEIPQEIKYLPDYCFEGCNIQKLTLRTIDKIGIFSHNDGGVKELYFETDVAPMADRIFFEKAIKDKMQIYIPSGARKKFSIGDWKKVVLHEIGENTTFNIVIEEAGKLENYITDDIANAATSLTLTGIIYDTEIPILEKCQGLTMLDLSKTIILKSKETVQKEKQETEALAAAFGMMFNLAAAQAQHDYELGKGNVADAIGTKAIADKFNRLIENTPPSDIKPSDECILPRLKFSMLEELRLPIVLKKINNYIVSDVKRIVFPPHIESIPMEAFRYCTNLEILEFPESVKEFTGDLEDNLRNCSKLKVLDFGKTKITDLPSRFFYAGTRLTVEKLILPSTLQSLEYFSVSLSRDCDLYVPVKEIKDRIFISEESNSKINKIRLHILKGHKAVWGSMEDLTGKVELIDDL